MSELASTDLTPPEGAEETSQSPDGVDLTLIRWMLSLSPAERLRAGQRFARSVLRIRRAAERT